MSTENKGQPERVEKRGLGSEIAGQVVGGVASGAAAVAAQQLLSKLPGGKDKPKK